MVKAKYNSTLVHLALTDTYARFKKFEYLLAQGKTGSRAELAAVLGITVRQVDNYKKAIEAYNGKILAMDKTRKTYKWKDTK